MYTGSIILEQLSSLWYFVPVRETHTMDVSGCAGGVEGAEGLVCKAPAAAIIAAAASSATHWLRMVIMAAIFFRDIQ